ncbi:S9 family peptidase [Portibacter marinus]|uniref:S9 family peptidase n=1 Tax=Portibacter marinus TaxID=2898660 RepID=UPI001F2CB4AD|nr:DPP IV N-terminal domain-containing protein [Portibacter marinus]
MKYLLWSLLLSANIAVLNAQNTPQPNYDLAARFSPDHLDKLVFSTSVTPHWLKNSERFWYMYETSEGKAWYIVDPAKGSKEALFDNVQIAADMSRLTGDPFDAKHLSISKLKFIDDERKLQWEVKSKLVEVDEEEDDMESEKDSKDKKKKPKKVAKVWHFEYDLTTKTLTLVEDFKKEPKDKDWASISPDSSYVLFSRDHNLYWMDKENFLKAQKDEKDSTIVEHQWTEDGEKDYAFGGSNRGVDNVEEEENKDKRQSVRVVWSPSGQKFALIRDDSRKVKDLWVLDNTAQPRPRLETYKYAMAGDEEVGSEEMYVFDFPSKQRKLIEIDTFKDQSLSILRAPSKKTDRDEDRRWSTWLSPDDSKLYFSRTSRDLKKVDFGYVDLESNEEKVLIKERLNTYIDTRTPGLVNGGEELIHWSERDGWAHFYLYDNQGNLKNQITKGPFHSQSIEGIDTENRVLYFTAAGREDMEDPYYYHLYKVNFDGSGLKLLNPGNYNHDAEVNDNMTYFVDNYSRVNTIPKSALFNTQGKLMMDLESADLDRLFETGYQFPEPYKVKAADGITDLYGVMYKPFDFDSTLNYPLIEYVYPGPQTEAVNKQWSGRMDRADRLAQMGFIVVSIGNRGGHPSRSKWYHNYGYGNLRDYGLEDKKYAAEQLGDRHDFIDLDKVGIFGHSGGGFMSTAAMLVYPDFFDVAVSSSGNHENNIYNRWWSEKHHGIKEIIGDSGEISWKYDIDKNPDLAKNLKGKLLITTGDIDNNVHPAGTIRMAQALIKANKRFDYFVFPGQRHGYGDMREYFFWMMADYFAEHLLGSSDNETDIKYMNNERARTK